MSANHLLPQTRKWVEGYKRHWLREHPCPDLQELVQQYGGYDKITPEAWAEYNLALIEWKNIRRGALLLGATLAA